jgi:transposase-like protein
MRVYCKSPFAILKRVIECLGNYTHRVAISNKRIITLKEGKVSFGTDIALLKLVYLATQRIQDKWTSPLQNWGLTVLQLTIKFEGRLDLGLKI